MWRTSLEVMQRSFMVEIQSMLEIQSEEWFVLAGVEDAWKMTRCTNQLESLIKVFERRRM